MSVSIRAGKEGKKEEWQEGESRLESDNNG